MHVSTQNFALVRLFSKLRLVDRFRNTPLIYNITKLPPKEVKMFHVDRWMEGRAGKNEATVYISQRPVKLTFRNSL
jgi:hypothetical protein